MDFKRVRRSGKSYAHPLLVLIVLPNQESPTVRIGISASHAVGNAVVRNRAKRRIRAIIDALLPDLKPGWDMIFLARVPIREAGFQEIEMAAASLLQRAGVIGTKVVN
jgi:ribonuclease P protein component